MIHQKKFTKVMTFLGNRVFPFFSDQMNSIEQVLKHKPLKVILLDNPNSIQTRTSQRNMTTVCNNWQPLSYHLSKHKTHIYIDKLHNSLITMSIKLFLKSCRLSKCVLTWHLAQTSPEIVQTGSGTLPQESRSVSLLISTIDSLQIFSQMLSTLIWKKKKKL